LLNYFRIVKSEYKKYIHNIVSHDKKLIGIVGARV